MKTYKRIALRVDAEFLAEGGFLPTRVIFDEKTYEIKKILRIKKYCPQTVGCIAPIEYTVVIDNIEKKIYYEEETKSWFSIKEIQK